MTAATTRHTLLEASAQEILAHGYAGASLTSIAARLGLTKGALAYHFPAKKDLAEALLDCLRQAMEEEFAAARQRYPDHGLHALITMLLGLGLRTASEPQAAAGLMLVVDRSSPVVDVAEIVSEWQHHLAEFVTMAQAAGEFDTTLAAEDVAEHLVVITIGTAALADRTFRRDGRERLGPIRRALALLGATGVDRIVEETVRSHPPEWLPPISGIPRKDMRP